MRDAETRFFGRAEPAPSEGWTVQGEMALRGKAGDPAEGDFVGGARSPRPRCMAIRKPRRVITNEGWANARLPCGDGVSVEPCPVCGRAEPAPPRRGMPDTRRLTGKGPGDDAEGVFSEGRGLRARIARPCASRGMSLSPMGRR